MPEKTAAQKRAQKNYMDKFAIARVRMEKGRYEDIQTAAAVVGESVNSYINTAITQRIERDSGGAPPEVTRVGLESAVAIPTDTLGVAERAAEATGETLADFIRRAVETQAKRDRSSLELGINPATGGKLDTEG